MNRPPRVTLFFGSVILLALIGTASEAVAQSSMGSKSWPSAATPLGVSSGNAGNFPLSPGGLGGVSGPGGFLRAMGIKPNSPTVTPVGQGMWMNLPTMPKQLGEVALGIIDGTVYVVGEGSGSTLTYDIASKSWSHTAAAPRPFPGNHHSAEVFDGKWYVIGGFGSGSEARLQIYDPQSNSWSLGADMPWNGGSVNTALIGNKIVVCGGVKDDLFTTTQCAVYDPAANVWRMRSPMVNGRNHAAAATDGSKLFIFGGRGPGSGDTNMVANGFADIQCYDPATDSWDSSTFANSTLKALPVGRGGTGRALWHRGEFYVFGGETLNGPGAVSGNVYDRVDIYNPNTNSWRAGTPMPTPRHGIFPVRLHGNAFLMGGGKVAGGSQSSVSDLYLLP
ncbi:MAG: kelch repeat-containing protein [Planctomycetota bacterium]|nr:kelch repeat-containing protein [Planctomycetota bacterium]